jgi:hypothetical protein
MLSGCHYLAHELRLVDESYMKARLIDLLVTLTSDGILQRESA